MEVLRGGITLKFTEEETDALATVIDLVEMLNNLSGELWKDGYNTNIDVFGNDVNVESLTIIRDEIVANNHCIAVQEKKYT